MKKCARPVGQRSSSGHLPMQCELGDSIAGSPAWLGAQYEELLSLCRHDVVMSLRTANRRQRRRAKALCLAVRSGFGKKMRAQRITVGSRRSPTVSPNACIGLTVGVSGERACDRFTSCVTESQGGEPPPSAARKLGGLAMSARGPLGSRTHTRRCIRDCRYLFAASVCGRAHNRMPPGGHDDGRGMATRGSRSARTGCLC